MSLDGGVEEFDGIDVGFCGGIESLERDHGGREGDRRGRVTYMS